MNTINIQFPQRIGSGVGGGHWGAADTAGSWEAAPAPRRRGRLGGALGGEAWQCGDPHLGLCTFQAWVHVSGLKHRCSSRMQ